jgi:heptosyltransferase-2
VLTFPLFDALKKRHPGAVLSVLAVPRTKEILDGQPGIDEVLVYDKRVDQRGLRGLVRMARTLSDRGFDLCILPHRSFRSALLAWMARIPKRVGFRGTMGSFLYTDRMERDPELHEVDRNLSLLGLPGVETSAGKGRRGLGSLVVDPAARAVVERVLQAEKIGPEDCLVGVAPGSVWATKRWLPEGFSAVCDRLAEERGARLLLLGSKDDLPVIREIIARCRRKPVSLAGQTIPELVATLSLCRLLITNDNGAMHIGALLGLPIVAVFGSTSPAAGFGPYTDSARIVERTLHCRPCGPHGHRSCPEGHFRCMREIAPEAVLAAADQHLSPIVHG